MNNSLNELNGPVVSETKTIIDLSDVLEVCRQYTVLGWGTQNQIECLAECGVEEAIDSGKVNRQALPHIRDFLQSITERLINSDVVDQAYSILMMIDHYELKHPQILRKVGN